MQGRAPSVSLHNAASNWFLTWNNEDGTIGDGQKSFLLQIKLENLYHRDMFSDMINSYTVVYRQRPCEEKWVEIGRTQVIRDEPDPEYAQGFPVSYAQDTDLSEDLLKVVVWNRRDTMVSSEEAIGAAKIRVRELVRTFGTRVRVELQRRGGNGETVGSAWFLGEALPSRLSCMTTRDTSDRVLEFCLRIGRMRMVHSGTRLYVTLARQRGDGTWSMAYRSGWVRRAGGASAMLTRSRSRSRSLSRSRRSTTKVEAFRVRVGELVLGESTARVLRVALMMRPRGHMRAVCIAQMVTCVDELVDGLAEGASVGLEPGHVGDVDGVADVDDVDHGGVGEFAVVGRSEIGQMIRLEAEINMFDAKRDEKEARQRRRNGRFLDMGPHFQSGKLQLEAPKRKRN